LVDQITKHLDKLRDEPDSPAARGWRTEVRAWADKVRGQIKHMGKKTSAKWRKYVEEVERALQESQE
jgi:hypothetical protein